ncbi:hypothetical protein DV736_g6133, partial [Chaetothyriales sp. CBS 134916]
MPICITCSSPIPHLYTTYSKADSPTLGKGVRLTQCPNCKRFADKYVEHDFVVLFIDLVLIKPQVYRHLLFNRLGTADTKAGVSRIDPSILRLGTLLVLFDVYITWARIEKAASISSSYSDTALGTKWLLSESPIIIQYLFFLTMNIFATIAQHGIILFLVQLLVRRSTAANKTSSPIPSGASHSQPVPSPRPGVASPAAISTALLVSSCTKLFPILLVIWPTSTSPEGSSSKPSTLTSFTANASSYVGWAVLLNNIEALLILLDCGYVIATTLALSGIAARWVIESWALGLVGLHNPRWTELGVVPGILGSSGG